MLVSKKVTLSSLVYICFGISYSFSLQWNINHLIGNVEVNRSNGFQTLSPEFSAVTGVQLFLRQEVADAFALMNNAFYKDFGYYLQLNSAYRSFEEQKKLWDAYPDLQLRITALPGTSQHHCCAIDIDKNHKTRTKIVSPRLEKHASSFGFILPYEQESDYGYEQEDRHFVYKPLLDEYKVAFYLLGSNEILDSINNNSHATTYNIMQNYILGVNFSKILRKRMMQAQLKKQKSTLKYLAYRFKNKELSSGYQLLGTGDQGESYYKLQLDAHSIIEHTVANMIGKNTGYSYAYFARNSGGILLSLSGKQLFRNKRIIYVIMGPTLP